MEMVNKGRRKLRIEVKVSGRKSVVWLPKAGKFNIHTLRWNVRFVFGLSIAMEKVEEYQVNVAVGGR